MDIVLTNGLVVTPTARDVRAERATIVIEGDRIARVAWGAEAARATPGAADRVIDASRSIVIPGLVDAHAHCYGVLIPGLIDRLPLDTRMPPLAACLAGWTDRDTWVATALGTLRMLRHGTTTVLENVLQGLDAAEPAAQALLATGIRAVVGPMVADRPYHETMPGLRERLPQRYWPDVSAAPGAPPEEVVGRCRDIARRWHGAEGR